MLVNCESSFTVLDSYVVFSTVVVLILAHRLCGTRVIRGNRVSALVKFDGGTFYIFIGRTLFAVQLSTADSVCVCMCVNFVVCVHQ